MNKFFVPLLCLSVLSACTLKKSVPPRPVARVGENYLTQEELGVMMPQGMMLSDSAEVAQKKVAAWVSSQVILQKAQNNLDQATYDRIEKQIADYRRSLIVYNYVEQITRRLLDTLIADREIEEYYQQNRSQFTLKSNIVRLRFVKVQKNSRQLAKIKKGLFDMGMEEDGDLLKFADLCREYADNYFLDGEQWLYFNDVLREIPVKTYNQEEFLKNYRNLEVESGEFMYYVTILDFKIRDMVSPLSFEKDRIGAIILNQRKRALLDEMEKDLMEEAVRNGQVQYYGENAHE